MKKIDSTDKLCRALGTIVTKQRILLFLAGVMSTLSAMIVSWIGLSLLAAVLILPVWSKVVVLSLSAMVTLFFFGRFALARLARGSIDEIAISLENQHQHLKGRLIAAIQFARSKPNRGFSQELVELTHVQALNESGGINFSEALAFYPILKTGRRLAMAGVVAVGLLLVMPGMFSHSYEVYSNVGTVIAPPLGYRLIPVPGATEWVKYRDIRIGAAIIGDKLPDKATIHHRLVGGSWQKTEIDVTKQRRFVSDFGDSVIIGINLHQINKSLDYYVEAGRASTEIMAVDVVDRPRVNSIKLSIFYPQYTGLEPTVIDENSGSFSAVIGSRANLALESNLPVEQAFLVLSDSSRLPLKLSGRKAETSLLVEQSLSYYVRLIDHLGEENPDPIEYYLTAIPDEYPVIDVIRPGFDVNLNDEMILPLKVRISDDFGFSSLALKYSVISRRKRSDENVAILHFSERIKTEGEVEFNWDMDPLHLYPGDYVEYYLELADNDMISGPKVSESRHFIARLPSLDEIIAESQGESARRIVRTDQLLKTGRDLSERLQAISRKMKARQNAGSQTDWQQKKELQSIVDKNIEMHRQIEKLAQEMEKSVEKAAENSLLSSRIMETLAQLQKLYEEVATPEMKEAQRKLMEALEKMDPRQLNEAMKEFELSQEELLKRLERTIALLKRMQLEQKMEAMLRQVEELIERQEEVNKKTEESKKAELAKLSPTEEDINSSLESLKDELAELDELLKEAEMDNSSEAKKFSEALKNTDAGKNMQQMSKELQQQKKSSAMSQGKEALSKLMSLLNQMQQQLAAMQGGDQDAIKKAMRMALDDANYLSENQEELLKSAGRIDPRSIVLRDMAASQQDLAAACTGLKNRIADLGKMSPFVAAELQSLVEDAVRGMELATLGLDQKKGFQATQNQRESMSKLNKASIRLMESMEQQKQCDKGGSCSKPTQKLQSLCEKQNQLNQKTQSQCNNPGNSNPKPGQGERSAFERLAGEQGSIRKSIEELNAEFGNSRQILGRLDDLAKEMKEIEEALEEGNVGQELVDRQVRIYSRMLEASRSLYRKDFTEQRKAGNPSEQLFYLPPGLADNVLNDRVKLEDRLREYLGEDYPPQYEKQIKAYFKALLQLESDAVSTPR